MTVEEFIESKKNMCISDDKCYLRISEKDIMKAIESAINERNKQDK